MDSQPKAGNNHNLVNLYTDGLKQYNQAQHTQHLHKTNPALALYPYPYFHHQFFR